MTLPKAFFGVNSSLYMVKKLLIMSGQTADVLLLKSFPQKINEKPQVIADYECGRAIPNNQVMGKIERAIGKSVLKSHGLVIVSLNLLVCLNRVEIAWEGHWSAPGAQN